MSQDITTDDKTATVSESKFNATATLEVEAGDEREAKRAAKEYFRDTHGSDPSQAVVEEKDGGLGRLFDDDARPLFRVMVADHSSGSNADDAEYTF